LPLSEWLVQLEKCSVNQMGSSGQDVCGYIDRWKEFYEEPSIQSKDYRDSCIQLRCAFKDFQKSANSLQLAVSSCALQLTSKYRKQLYQWVGGGGKSVIMTCIGLLALTTDSGF
jgi:hypothetical protein